MTRSKCVCACVFSRIQLFVTPWTVAQQAHLSMGFPRQEYWSGLPFPPPGDLPHPGMEFMPPVSPTLAGEFFTSWAIREALTKSPKCIPLVFCLSKLFQLPQWPLSTYQQALCIWMRKSLVALRHRQGRELLFHYLLQISFASHSFKSGSSLLLNYFQFLPQTF